MTAQQLVGPVVAALMHASAVVSPVEESRRADGWELTHATLATGAPVSATHIALVRGIAVRDDLSSVDGTIEADLDASRTSQFAGIAFRLVNTANYEIVYFRGDSTGWKEVQYQPVFDGEPTWQLYTGPGYNADLPAAQVPAGAPMHVKIVFAGRRADVYVDRSPSPVLQVPRLARAPLRGRVAVWAGGGADARSTFTGFTATPRADVELAPIAEPEPLPGQIMTWRISDRLPSPDTIVPPGALSGELRTALSAAQVASAEPSGLVNLSRILGNPAGPQVVNVPGGAGWGLALATVTIHAERAQMARLRFTFSDGAAVFLNDRQLFSGTNPYASPTLGRLVSDANVVDLPLVAGANELVVAVTDRAFGWGFRARLDAEPAVTVSPGR